MYRRRRGLGVAFTWGGTPVYSLSELPKVCSSGWLKYAITPQCWTHEFSAWGQMAALPEVPNLTVAPHAIPSGYGQGPASVDQAERETDEVLAEAWAEQQSNIREWGAGLPDNPIPAVPCSFFNIPCWAFAVGAGVVGLGLVAALTGGRRR